MPKTKLDNQIDTFRAIGNREIVEYFDFLESFTEFCIGLRSAIYADIEACTVTINCGNYSIKCKDFHGGDTPQLCPACTVRAQIAGGLQKKRETAPDDIGAANERESERWRKAGGHPDAGVVEH